MTGVVHTVAKVIAFHDKFINSEFFFLFFAEKCQKNYFIKFISTTDSFILYGWCKEYKYLFQWEKEWKRLTYLKDFECHCPLPQTLQTRESLNLNSQLGLAYANDIKRMDFFTHLLSQPLASGYRVLYCRRWSLRSVLHFIFIMSCQTTAYALQLIKPFCAHELLCWIYCHSCMSAYKQQ